MLEAGIIEPSNSEWSTPIVMIKKPNGTYRFCLDFRKLNDVSKKDAYPLPYMNSILDKLRAARYISTIDLSQAYFQIPLEKNRLTVDPEKTVAILEYPPPRNIRQLRRFIGMASWYRRFIPQCAARLEPLTSLLRKNRSWEWGDTQKQAFEVIKSCLVNSPTLSCPDFEKPFVVQTDASSVGLGAALSRGLSFHGGNRPQQPTVAAQFKKPYGPTSEMGGAMHHVPDALSRMYEGGEELCAAIATDDQWYVGRAEEITRNPRRYPDWKLEGDELYVRKTRGIARVVGDRDQWKRVVPRETRREVIRENHDPPHAGHLGVDKTYQRIALRYHWPRMYRDVAEYVRRCDTCQRTKVEQDAPAGLMGQRVIESPWTVVAADIMGPLPTSKAGHSYLLVLQDLFTKWVECCPLRKATGKRIREAIEELVIYRWGTPRVLLTDNGTEFVNRDIQALTQRCGIHHATVPPYHPQANPVERVNRVLKTMITAFVDRDHREWDVHVHEFRFAYNSAHHTSLQATPAFLNLGREPPPVGLYRDEAAVEVERTEPAEWRERMERLEALQEWVVENLEAAQEKQAKYYNRRHRDRQFEVGEQVLKRHHVLSSGARHFSAKLARKFHGPFIIRRILSPVVYELADLTGEVLGRSISRT
ncbi:uncharacterized protein LOC118648039 [Monomorium pharaonis]|uniref:uncharacterized protein LOC118648039 n=1 Tax=Monomorium pharaonis TaxID=307658 RepID=UPI001745FEDD|nr:uncharacterized protein LOC118648039 [Monomorium pharaonis]